MKSERLIKGGIFCGILAMFLLYALYFWEPSKTVPFEKRYTFVSPSSLWIRPVEGILQAGSESNANVKLYAPDSADSEKQIQVLQNIIKAKPDGIITAASENSDAFVAVIESAKSAGIPVVLIDSDSRESLRDVYIGTDNENSGYTAGLDMIEATGGKAKIGIIVSDMSYPNQADRVEGFQKAIADYPEMEIVDIVECHSEKIEILQQLPDLLESCPELDALFLTEAISGTIAGEILSDAAYKERNLSVVAFDDTVEARRYLETGIYYSFITQNPRQAGYLAVDALNRILDGETMPEFIYIDSISIKRENMTDLIEQEAQEIKWYLY